MLSLKCISLHVCSTRSCQQQENIRKRNLQQLFERNLPETRKSLETRFTTEFNYSEVKVNASTKDANIGLKKIYGLIGSGSASASEALLGGLMPYTNVRLIGTQTHGKYCTGWMLSAEEMYEKCPQELENWGIYVMVSIYQNADGKTPCMPDGLIPDIQIEDDPIQPYQIGDVNEPS